MPQEKPIIFDDNKIPVLFDQTVGKVTFVAKRENKFERDEEGNYTDIVRLQSIEVSSEAQRETFNVDVPADFDLSLFKFGDTIEIEGVEEAEPWARLPAGDQNINNAFTGFSVLATGIRKVNLNDTPSNTNTPPVNQPQKSENKGEKGKDK
ncbi:DUF961 domain-containing protein [Enterococcus faecalis]|nr:DUF961 domain-containing protein [Enterococcus faecalis]EHL0041120.1 DUF961 family protein [Enterococcus faecalis]